MFFVVATLYCCKPNMYERIDIDSLTNDQIEKIKNYKGCHFYDDIKFARKLKRSVITDDEHMEVDEEYVVYQSQC